MNWITPRPAIAAATLTLAVSALPAAPVDAERLEALVETLDERREAMHIPGMAIAVVKDGEVILARGLGVADIDTDRPVTPDTIFCIGSSSKTITAAMAGIGVDRGKLEWDAPVSTYIPWFKLPEAEGSEAVNLIDLLSHRTGLTRMSLLWYGGTADRETIYATVPEASYYHPFRESWFYNNVTFAAAGFAAAAVENTTWEDLLQRDILDPVGMADTSPAHEHLANNPNAARGYLWDTEEESFKPLPPRVLSLIAPAGAINSSVNDMAKWVRVLLNDGALPDGTQLISEASLAQCWTPHATMPNGGAYGLGWMINDFQSTPYYEHGGNIDGFASTLAVMPDEGIGLTALMNVSASPMQAEVIQLVFDTLLNEPAGHAEEDGAAEDFSAYEGAYFFAALGGDLVVSADDEGGLACELPGQGTTALNAPDDEGYRAFAVNPAIKVRFQSDDTGRIVALEFYQGPAELLLPKRDEDGELITPGVPFDEHELALLTGKFFHDLLRETCEVILKDGQLSMDVPSQQAYPLAWDAANERWRFRDFPGIVLEFTQDTGSPATAIEFTQNGRTTTMPRVDGPDPDDLPSIADLEALRAEHLGTGQLAETRTMRITGRVKLIHQGVSGTWTAWADGRDRHAQRSDFSPFAISSSSHTAERSVDVSPMAPEPTISEPGTATYEISAGSHPWLGFAPLAWYAPKARVSGIEEFGDTPDAVVVVAEAEHAPPMRLYLDPDDGRTLGIRASIPIPGMGTIPIVTTLKEWRDVGGVRIPHRMEVSNPFTGEMVIECESVEFDVPVPPEVFDID